MQNPENNTWDPNLQAHAIGNELRERLRSLIETARADLRPRDFAERHLVDELAICKWRQLRVLAMQTAIYRHEEAEHTARHGTASGNPSEQPTAPDPAGDMYFYAMCHAPDRHGVVLAALARLESRYHRQFCNALRLLTALRRQNPLALSPPEAG